MTRPDNFRLDATGIGHLWAVALSQVVDQLEPWPPTRPNYAASRRPMPPPIANYRPGHLAYDIWDHRAAARAYRDKIRSLDALGLPITAGWVA